MLLLPVVPLAVSSSAQTETRPRPTSWLRSTSGLLQLPEISTYVRLIRVIVPRRVPAPAPASAATAATTTGMTSISGYEGGSERLPLWARHAKAREGCAIAP
jgi:hypothetical protein